MVPSCGQFWKYGRLPLNPWLPSAGNAGIVRPTCGQYGGAKALPPLMSPY